MKKPSKDFTLGRIINGRYTEATLIRNRRAIFFSLPKNANTSIRKAINNYNGIPSQTFSEIHQLNKYRLREKTLKRMLEKGYFVFCFVRDPEERIKSAYRDFVQGKGMRDKAYPIKGVHKDMTFKEFRDFVKSTPQEELEYHLKNQEELIRKGLSGYKLDFIGRVKYMKEGWKRVCFILNLNIKLEKLHVTK